MYKEPFELIYKTIDQIKEFKIIIIDNDNNYELKTKILKHFDIYKYILNKKNNGFSAGYNQGIKISSTLFTLVLGPDCLITPKDIYILTQKCSLYQTSMIIYSGHLNDIASSIQNSNIFIWRIFIKKFYSILWSLIIPILHVLIKFIFFSPINIIF